MIAGVFLRNYKSFYNFNYVPLIFSNSDKITVFAGDNGSGKSTVLESIDCVLNNLNPDEWECSHGQKRDRMQIYLVFLVRKDRSSIFKDYPLEKLLELSNAYWEGDFSKYSKDDVAAAEFTYWRNNLKEKIDSSKYYLICIGRNHINQAVIYGLKCLKNYCGELNLVDYRLNDLINFLQNDYKYIYIPVENKIDQVLDIKARELHNLMGKRVFDELDKVLTEKNVVTTGSGSVISAFNDVLESYLQEINSYIEPEYKFSSKGGAIKRSVKASDFINILINVFFSTRPLQKDGKIITSLSSGQKRIALIDVFAKIVEKIKPDDKNLLIAIDEPESSLDNLNKFRQFQRLVSLPKKKDCQIFITTHWYGVFLYPIKGRLNFLQAVGNQSNLTESFSLEYLYDERKKFPESIEMKSYFDLMSSMYSLIRSDSINWIICEGRTDVNYLKKYIGSNIPDLNIVAFNGFGNVKRLYELLNFAIGEKEEILGRVLFIIDTDTENFVTNRDYSKSENIRLVRWHLDRKKDISKINNLNSTNASKTVIEDVVDSEFMFTVVKDYTKSFSFNKKLVFNNEGVHADISGDLGFLNTKDLLGSEIIEIKKVLSEKGFKAFSANRYINSTSTNKKIPAFEEVIGFFA